MFITIKTHKAIVGGLLRDINELRERYWELKNMIWRIHNHFDLKEVEQTGTLLVQRDKHDKVA